MAGSTVFKELQLGQEVTNGTKVVSTTKWRGVATPRNEVEVIFVDEFLGNLAPGDLSYVGKLAGGFDFVDTVATYEQLPYLFQGGIKKVAPVQDGAGTDYISAFAVHTTTKNAIQAFTVEGGDDQQEYEGGYGFVESFQLSGAMGDAVMMNSNWIVDQIVKGTFTAAQAAPTVAPLLVGDAKIYIDATAGTFGTTQVTTTVLGFTLAMNTGIKRLYTMDGQLFFTDIEYTRPEITLELRYRHNTSAVAEYDAWLAETIRLIRIEFTGPAVATPGTTYSNYTYRMDLAGKYASFGAIEDDDGNSIVVASLNARYSPVDAFFAEFTVVNEDVTLV